MIVRILLILIVMLLNLYPAVEMTRVILFSGTHYYPALMLMEYRIEIALIWTCWLLTIPALIGIFRIAGFFRGRLR